MMPETTPAASKPPDRIQPLCPVCPKRESCAFPDVVQHAGGSQPTVVITRYPAGQQLLMPGRPVTGMHLLCEGRAAVSIGTALGQEIAWVVGVSEALDMKDNLLERATHSVTAWTLMPTTLAFLRFDLLKNILTHNAVLVANLLRDACGQIHQWEERFACQMSSSVIRRTLHLFLDLAEGMENPGSKSVTLPIELSRNKLAALVATTPETVSRVLTKLRRGRLVEHAASRVVIPDMDRLRAALRKSQWGWNG